MSSAGVSVTVEIYGRTYQLRAQNDRDVDYVTELARRVHEKMEAVEQSTNTVDSMRVAVLAALNLADEYCILREQYKAQIRELKRERAQLAEMIEKVLKQEQLNSLPDS